ncbi:MAG TPA: hypothetical protein VLS89_05265 [Candidatus Nanopelagicales bacterium]|nr:hypothetical protein [Candidatus Nanopelagicales bacterium]
MALLAFLVATPAQAADRVAPPATLDYRRGPGAEACPDEAAFRREVAALLERDPFQPASDLRVITSLARRAGELRADLKILDSGGQTAWRSEITTPRGCGPLVASMALAVVIALEDLGRPRLGAAPRANAAARPAPASAPCPPEQPCPPVKPRSIAPPPPRAPTAAPDPDPRLEVSLLSQFATGLVPGPAAGLLGSAEARWPGWGLALELRGLLGLSSVVDGVPVQATFGGTSVAFCLQGELLFGCARAELGQTRFASNATIRMDPAQAMSVGLAARLGLAWRFSRYAAARATLELLATPNRTELWLRPASFGAEERRIWSSSALSPSISLGVVGGL